METWNDSPSSVRELPASEDQVAEDTPFEPWSSCEGSAPEEKLWSFENGPHRELHTFEASSIPEHPKRKCIVIGPPGSGKTGFLQAIERACQVPVDEHYRIRVVPFGRTASLMGQAISSFTTGQGLGQPFEVIDSLQFGVGIRRGSKGSQRYSAETFLEMIFKELPSRVAFPGSPIINGSRPQEATEEVRTADSLVLLVDALDPRTELWYEHLPIILDSFRESNARYLRVDRILVLLSRVDLLCDAVMRPHRLAGKASPRSFKRLAGATPADLAHAIDPLEQTCELLGKPILKAVLDVLRPGASLAVGIVSAGGFVHKSGEPLWNATGQCWSCQGGASSSALRLWEPYGIREAVLYLAIGQADSPIVPLSYADLAQTQGITIYEIREEETYAVDE
jgi:hypothetical protein